MALPKNPSVMTRKQFEAFGLHEVQGKTIPETAAVVGVTEKTIDRWKNTHPAWRDLAIAAIEDAGHTMGDYAAKLVEMKDKKKQINVDGNLETVDDNSAQVAYLKEIGAIYGVYAPKELDLTHSVAKKSDAEFAEEFSSAAKEYGMDGRPGEPREGGGDSQAVEGTVL